MLRQFLEVGQITSTHGVRGEMRVNPWCDSPEFLKKFKTLYLDEKGEKSVKVNSRIHGNMVLMKIEGINTVEEAAKMRNKVLYMNRNDASIPENTFYIQDLICCKVLDFDSGKVYGVISDVSETGANDVWHIKKDGKEYLIPAIPDVVIDTDVKNEKVYIRPLKGIFDDED